MMANVKNTISTYEFLKRFPDEKLSFGVGFSTGDDVDAQSFSVRINL